MRLATTALALVATALAQTDKAHDNAAARIRGVHAKDHAEKAALLEKMQRHAYASGGPAAGGPAPGLAAAKPTKHHPQLLAEHVLLGEWACRTKPESIVCLAHASGEGPNGKAARETPHKPAERFADIAEFCRTNEAPMLCEAAAPHFAKLGGGEL